MITYALDPFYYVIIGVIVCCFLYIIFCYYAVVLAKNAKVTKMLKEYLTTNNISYKLTKSKQCDYVLKINDKEYLVKIADVKKNSELQIGVTKSVVMFYNNITNTLKSREIDEASEFIKQESKNKIILLNAKVKSIVYNKNELEVVTLKDKEVYQNTLFINFDNFENIIK